MHLRLSAIFMGPCIWPLGAGLDMGELGVGQSQLHSAQASQGVKGWRLTTHAQKLIWHLFT